MSLLPNSADPMVVMGRVAAAHGVRGWVKILAFTEYMDSLLDYPVWYLAATEADPWQAVKISQVEVHHKFVVAQLPNCPDRTAAEKLRGWLIGVPRSAMPEPEDDEFYWSDLIGLNVVNAAGLVFGQVKNLLETGANDVLVVQGEHGEVLIPFVDAVIQQVDLKARQIRVDWLLEE